MAIKIRIYFISHSHCTYTFKKVSFSFHYQYDTTRNRSKTFTTRHVNPQIALFYFIVNSFSYSPFLFPLVFFCTKVVQLASIVHCMRPDSTCQEMNRKYWTKKRYEEIELICANVCVITIVFLSSLHRFGVCGSG